MQLLFGKGAMGSETLLRQEIRYSLGFVRSMIDHYSGLYSGENLTHDVLRFCNGMIAAEEPNPRLKEARRIVEERCRQLAQAHCELRPSLLSTCFKTPPSSAIRLAHPFCPPDGCCA